MKLVALLRAKALVTAVVRVLFVGGATAAFAATPAGQTVVQSLVHTSPITMVPASHRSRRTRSSLQEKERLRYVNCVTREMKIFRGTSEKRRLCQVCVKGLAQAFSPGILEVICNRSRFTLQCLKVMCEPMAGLFQIGQIDRAVGDT